MKRNILFSALAVIVITAAVVIFAREHAEAPTPTSNSSQTHNQTEDNPSTTVKGFDSAAHSLTDPASIWVLVNKHRPLVPKTYTPTDLVTPDVPKRGNITADERQLRAEPAAALEKMVAAAAAQGVHLTLQSGYRSYSFQVNLYNRYVQQQGQAAADSQSARPGFSEHQTGLAADLGGASRPSCDVDSCFADTPEGAWLAAHAYNYGFIVRYPEGKTAITGYIAEPWHMRYVGFDLAKEMHDKNISTLEEFFGLEAAPDYQ